MFAQASDFAVWYWCLLPKMAYLCVVECTNPISLEMAMAAYRQIAEVQQSQGSEEQQEPPQKKLRLGTTEAVATANPWTHPEREQNRRFGREEADRRFCRDAYLVPGSPPTPAEGGGAKNTYAKCGPQQGQSEREIRTAWQEKAELVRRERNAEGNLVPGSPPTPAEGGGAMNTYKKCGPRRG